MPTSFKVFERNSLLLNPGKIPQIEDPLAITQRQFLHQIGANPEQVLTERLCRGKLIKSCGK